MNNYYLKNVPNKGRGLFANRDIKKDEELTVNYSGVNGSSLSIGNSWFDSRNIEFKE